MPRQAVLPQDLIDVVDRFPQHSSEIRFDFEFGFGDLPKDDADLSEYLAWESAYRERTAQFACVI